MEPWNQYSEFPPEFRVLLTRYRAIVIATIMPSTANGHLTAIKDFFRYLMKKHPHVIKLSDVRRMPHIEGWLADLASRNLCKSTRKHHSTNLRKVFSNIYDWEWEDVPVPGLITSKDMPRLDSYLPKPLTPSSDAKLQVYLHGKITLMAQALFLLRRTGLRIGELRDLDVECLKNGSEGNYILHVPLGKLHSERALPVDSVVVDIIKNIRALRPTCDINPTNPKGIQYLIVNRYYRRPSYAGLLAALSRMALKSGITTHIHPHMLRHTYATELLRAGINIFALMKLMGHKSISMTLRYAGLIQTDVQKAYIAAIENSKSLYGVLLSEDSDLQHKGEPGVGSFLSGIKDSITKMESLHKDTLDRVKKKKIQRMVERLRRIYKNLEPMVKVN